jgi:predicted glycosyltransferase
MLDALAGLAEKPSIHLLLRDILDTPEATQVVWQAHDYHGAIARHYDSVLVVGERNIFDVGAEYAFPPETREKLAYCGYINRANPKHAERNSALKGQRPKVLMHAGGGQDGPALIEAAIGAIRMEGEMRGFDCTIIGGPELGNADKARLSVAVERLHDVEWLDFTDAMGSEIAAADLVVSMGGYNSVCEILSYRKRAIIVPRSYPVREQRIRAEAMDRLGLLKMIPLEQLSAVRLNREMQTELSLCNVVNSRTARISFKGLDVICDRLLGSIAQSEPKRLREAAL